MITVSIVTFRQTLQELYSLTERILKSNVEKLYLIDNSPNDALRVIEKTSDRIRYIHNANIGYGGGDGARQRLSCGRQSRHCFRERCVGGVSGLYGCSFGCWVGDAEGRISRRGVAVSMQTASLSRRSDPATFFSCIRGYAGEGQVRDERFWVRSADERSLFVGMFHVFASRRLTESRAFRRTFFHVWRGYRPFPAYARSI